MNGFKVIKGTALALCLSVTFSAQAFDFAKGLDAAVKLGKAATLSDSDINAYFGQMSKKYDAVICLGAVIRGDTTHYDHVSNEPAKGTPAAGQPPGGPVV